jgi:hypothetical protein
VGLTFPERQALRLLIDQAQRERAFEEEATRFVRTTVRGRRGVTRERLLRLRTRGDGVSDAAVDRAIDRLGVTPDERGFLRFPSEVER